MGCVMASFCVEKFSYENLRALDEATIMARVERFRALTRFESLELLPKKA
jgi:hypothetical protein